MDHTKPPTVLIVEDELLVRAVVAAEFAEAGFRVLEAGDDREALAALVSIRKSTCCSPTSACRASTTAG